MLLDVYVKKPTSNHFQIEQYPYFKMGRHGCDRMVVGFKTTCEISAYHH